MREKFHEDLSSREGRGVLSIYLVFMAGALASDYATVQEAIDKNAGQMVVVEGDHVVDAAVRLTVDGSGLCGQGRIVQSNPGAAVVEVEGAAGI